MMLELPDQWVWDFWVTRAQGTFHGFFLKAPRALEDPERRHSNASVGHAVSADLTTWSFLPDAMGPQGQPAFDDLAVWTGCVVADPAGGWRMFTTGISAADHGLVQRIGASWSPDLITWRRQSGPVMEADERWYATQKTGQRETHWRDPWVFQAGGIWHLVATAQSATTGTAVVAHAVSCDLTGWEIRPPLSLPSRRFAWAEVVTVMPVLGRWALTFSCMSDQMPHDAPGAGGVWSMPVPESAFTTVDECAEPVLDLDDAIRLTSEQLYAGRPVPTGDHEARFLAFRHHDESGRFVGGVIDPLNLEWRADGAELRLINALLENRAMLFPIRNMAQHARTGLDLEWSPSGLPWVTWLGHLPSGLPEHAMVAAAGQARHMPLLGEHGHIRFTRPHLRGYRIGPDGTAGRAWSTRFITDTSVVEEDRLRLTATDDDAELGVELELESLPGGSLRGRWSLTNRGATAYVVDALEFVLPVADHLTESLDFTGLHERERTPQRRPVTDGLWLREGRGGRPGLEGTGMIVVGTPGFDTTAGEVVAVHVAWSGNTVLRIERDSSTGTTIGGGELLLPGEVVLGPGDSYTTPWVFFATGENGLDDIAASWHEWQRSLPAHPAVQPVTFNAWEAVYFDHDLVRLQAIADRAARVGVERFVLDDGWFRNRRDDTSGLGDWWIDENVWPDGLTPLIDHVRRLGMGFGIWFEPEMVNPDSDLLREHPHWLLAAGPHRRPEPHRHQQALDLTRPEVWSFLYGRMTAILDAHPIDFVKWDHNRDLLEAGSLARAGAPAVHEQTQAFYRLLDALRNRFPAVTWESCASGGGRVDFGVLERVQRIWTSDMTDALARQTIQRWSTQLVAPEYLGAHVSSATSPTTGRTLNLDFRCATALFGSFGIEWDLTQATTDELDQLAGWVARYRQLREFLHSGRLVRPVSADPSVLLHGIIAADRSQALVAHVALDESQHNRGVHVRVPGLDPTARYALAWEGPVTEKAVSMSAPLPRKGPTDGQAMTGTALWRRGFWIPRRPPESATLIRLTRR